jgi:hypothetical protein
MSGIHSCRTTEKKQGARSERREISPAIVPPSRPNFPLMQDYKNSDFLASGETYINSPA